MLRRGGLPGALFSFSHPGNTSSEAASRDSDANAGPQGQVHPLGGLPRVANAGPRRCSGRPGGWPAGRSAGAALSFYVRAGPGTPAREPRPADNARHSHAAEAAGPRPLPPRGRRVSRSPAGRAGLAGHPPGDGGREGPRARSRRQPVGVRPFGARSTRLRPGGTGPRVLRGPGARAGTLNPRSPFMPACHLYLRLSWALRFNGEQNWKTPRSTTLLSAARGKASEPHIPQLLIYCI